MGTEYLVATAVLRAPPAGAFTRRNHAPVAAPDGYDNVILAVEPLRGHASANSFSLDYFCGNAEFQDLAVELVKFPISEMDKTSFE